MTGDTRPDAPPPARGPEMAVSVPVPDATRQDAPAAPGRSGGHTEAVSEAAVQAALDAVPKFWREAHAILQAYPSAALARAMLEGAAPLMRGRAEAQVAEIESLCRGIKASVVHDAVPIVAVDRILAITGTGDAPRPKLVRDKIPALIRAQGLESVTRTAAAGEMPALLRDKLAEEAAEFLASGDPAELADILEVLHALAGLAGVTAGELERLRAAKERERGGFAGRVVWTRNREPGAGEEARDG